MVTTLPETLAAIFARWEPHIKGPDNVSDYGLHFGHREGSSDAVVGACGEGDEGSAVVGSVRGGGKPACRQKEVRPGKVARV
jgi:hypothetical protein